MSGRAPAWACCACAAGRVASSSSNITILVRAQVVRREGGDPWDLRNALDVGTEAVCRCHARQHSAFQRIPLSRIPDAALDFIIELLGSERAALWLASHYSQDDDARRRHDKRLDVSACHRRETLRVPQPSAHPQVRPLREAASRSPASRASGSPDRGLRGVRGP